MIVQIACAACTILRSSLDPRLTNTIVCLTGYLYSVVSCANLACVSSSEQIKVCASLSRSTLRSGSARERDMARIAVNRGA